MRLTETLPFTIEDAEGYAAGDAAWAKENADLYDFFYTYGFEFTFTYPAKGQWDCTAGTKLSFTLDIDDGECDGYSFDYWYGEDATHVSEEMDEFLGEEDVSFTEDSLLGLGLYYVTGTVTAGGSDTTEVVYVYLMDPVYGTVCVYQLEEGGTINGNEITNIDTTYTNAFENVAYDLDDEDEGIGITFYQSTDHIGADGIILTSEDEGYEEEDNLFSAILTRTDCASDAIAIGCFECENCGTKVPVYASAAHTFGDDGLDMTAPPTESGKATSSKADFEKETSFTLYGDSATVITAIKTLFPSDSSWTVTINGEEYTYESETLKDAEGNEVKELSAGKYTVVLSLAEDYDAWSDGTTEDITYTFTVYPA